ncbi:MAG: cell division protein FtsA, partial [Petrotoga sp.]|nr:cell division protein FtsA [Petrotoga sp.]
MIGGFSMAKNYLIGIDIGSFFLKGVLFEIEEDGSIVPISLSKLPVDGIINGEIQDMESLRRSIETLIEKLNQESPKKIKNPEIIVGYSTNSLNITEEHFTVEFSKRTEIREEELRNIKKSIIKKYTDEGKIILDSNFVKFHIDEKKVKNPVSFFAEKSLTTTLNIVWVDENSFSLLINVLKDIVYTSEIPIYDSTLSNSYIITTPNDRNVGITVIDFGYNSCRIIIFKDGIPKLFYTFPYG